MSVPNQNGVQGGDRRDLRVTGCRINKSDRIPRLGRFTCPIPSETVRSTVAKGFQG